MTVINTAHQEERLAILDRSAVLDQDFGHLAFDLSLDLIHHLHGFDDTDHAFIGNIVPHIDKDTSLGRRRPVEGADHGAGNLFLIRSQGGRHITILRWRRCCRSRRANRRCGSRDHLRRRGLLRADQRLDLIRIHPLLELEIDTLPFKMKERQVVLVHQFHNLANLFEFHAFLVTEVWAGILG